MEFFYFLGSRGWVLQLSFKPARPIKTFSGPEQRVINPLDRFKFLLNLFAYTYGPNPKLTLAPFEF